jgi:hypothetical protein
MDFLTVSKGCANPKERRELENCKGMQEFGSFGRNFRRVNSRIVKNWKNEGPKSSDTS